MPSEPQIAVLSSKRRQRFFLFLVLVFMLTLPMMIFYTTGYRLDFGGEENTIVTTGGMYITTDNLEVDVYLDGEQVESPRLFRSAYYIQNIEAGQHRVVVQRPDLYTWVKELPVDSRIVVEAAAFNMPLIPHVRPITKYVTETDAPVFSASEKGEALFSGVTTTVPVLYATSSLAANFPINEEYIYAESLFSTTSTSTRSVFERILDEVGNFRFATTSAVDSQNATVTEEVLERGGVRLVLRDSELYAVWAGSINTIPFYFCVTDTPSTSTAVRYGQHVADQITDLKNSTTTPIIVDGNRLCRPEIKLDRLRQDVFFYDFFPGSSDLVLLQLEDGLYVTEIDDRAWQNVQLLYPGKDFQVVVENGVIYVHDGHHYFEIITEIEPI